MEKMKALVFHGVNEAGPLAPGCAILFRATRLSLIHIRGEAPLVRERLAPSKKAEATDD